MLCAVHLEVQLTVVSLVLPPRGSCLPIESDRDKAPDEQHQPWSGERWGADCLSLQAQQGFDPSCKLDTMTSQCDACGGLLCVISMFLRMRNDLCAMSRKER